MPIQKTRGFILQRVDIRETSVALHVYTRDFGKIKLISKGVRSPEHRFVSAYELFALDEIVFYEKKKRDYFLLSQCELLEYFHGIRATLPRISYASYFVELLNFVTQPGEKNEALYELLRNSLTLLSGTASPKRVARIFEIKLLSILGHMPRLKSCASCGKKPENQRTRFSLVRGGVLCENCFGSDKRALPVLAGTVNFISHIESLPFDKITHIKVAKGVGLEVERLLGSFINYHLNVKLKSAEFIAKIERGLAPL
ncbi:MAG: DNA repair protein RecO [Omnitrophica bacterium]|nr:DNA repair protein RecO [Candidatus Omnitrophota bacterium]